jgi:hypothetical protein
MDGEENSERRSNRCAKLFESERKNEGKAESSIDDKDQ